VYKDRFQASRNYDEAYDLTGITTVHKLYVGNRHWYKGPKKGTEELIYKWGPYLFICDRCGKSMKQYSMLQSHKEQCDQDDAVEE
jgi:hypothetical protein